jgi:putative ABC transport system ATP-binding protein
MLIEGVGLSLIYDLDIEDGTYALKDLNISITEGSSTAIIGPSGSGKSSLLYLLSTLKSPTLGTVYYNDMDIEALTEPQRSALRRKDFGFIFQRHFLIDYMTILDNVILASRDTNLQQRREKGLDLLKRLKLDSLAHKKPVQLSLGQRQKVAVARALMNEPTVIFADEPTASLDHKNALEVINLLMENKGKTTLVVVTHDNSILDNFDVIHRMWDGVLIKN